MSTKTHSTLPPRRSDNKRNFLEAIVIKRTKIRESTLIGTMLEYHRLIGLIKKGQLNDAEKSLNAFKLKISELMFAIEKIEHMKKLFEKENDKVQQDIITQRNTIGLLKTTLEGYNTEYQQEKRKEKLKKEYQLKLIERDKLSSEHILEEKYDNLLKEINTIQSENISYQNDIKEKANIFGFISDCINDSNK